MVSGQWSMVYAQSAPSSPDMRSPFALKAESIAQHYLDTLHIMRAAFDSIASKRNVTQSGDLLINPYYYRLFVPPMLYRSSLKEAMDIPKGRTASSGNLRLNSAINHFFLDMYTQHPHLVRYTDADLDREGGIRKDIEKKVDYNATVSDKVKVQEVEGVVEPIVAISRKPNFWTFGGKLKLQLMQNYISDN